MNWAAKKEETYVNERGGLIFIKVVPFPLKINLKNKDFSVKIYYSSIINKNFVNFLYI